jgi:hypothetical protein
VLEPQVKTEADIPEIGKKKMEQIPCIRKQAEGTMSKKKGETLGTIREPGAQREHTVIQRNR